MQHGLSQSPFGHLSRFMLLSWLLMLAPLRPLLAQVGINPALGIGTPTPDASAELHIATTTKGVLMPKVALTSTTTFGLTGDTKTAGMVVYNTSATLTGSAAYPASGVGLYTWDGTGWSRGALPPTTPQVVFVGKSDDYGGTSSTQFTYPVSLSSSYSATPAKVSISNPYLTFQSAGTYLVEGLVVGKLTGASTNGYVIGRLNGANGTLALVYATTNSSDPSAQYALPVSYIGSFSANDQIYFTGNTSGFSSSTSQQFKMQALKITQLN